MATRLATHAGTWYSSDRTWLTDIATKLDKLLSDWLKQAKDTSDHKAMEYDDETPLIATNPIVHGCKAIIAPFSGPSAAWAYGCIEPATIRRVFVLGPSHHAYLEGCALTSYAKLATPLGDLDVDQDLNKDLLNTKQFRSMPKDMDEDEHSLELHFPYIRKVFSHSDVKVIPILVGQLAPKVSKQYAETLAKYLAEPSAVAIISSDFCHWGHRFNYTYYQSRQSAQPQHLSLRAPPEQYANPPIHTSITALDAAGMASLSYSPIRESERVHESASEARKAFAAYLTRTNNTICGRNPLTLLLLILEQMEAQGMRTECLFTHYTQSSPANTPRDSSVSYAAGYVQSI